MRKVFALYKPVINQWKGKQNNCIILNTAAAAFPAAAASASTPKEEPKITKQVSSFKEKTNHRVVGDLLEYQRKALDDLKAKLILKGEQVSTFGIPLLVDERSDIILLKFLRARDFKIEDPYTRIQNTIRQRKHNNVDDGLLGKNEYEKIFFAYGHDKKGRHVCYNVYSEFEKTFGESENTLWKDGKREAFFKWLVKFIEKIVDDDDKNNKDDELINKGVNSILLVNDLNNFRRFDQGIDDYITIIQDNYPDFVVKQLCINTSWLDMAYYWIYWTVSDPTSKTKFVFASPSKTTDTLFKYIAPEQVPEQYGGLSKIGDENVLFSFADTVTQVTIKPNSAHSIEFTVTEATELVWELRVISWDVSYEAKFVPENEGVDTLNLSSLRNVLFSDQPVISGTFKTTEAGKVVITIDNQTSKKKKLLYRSKMDKVSSVR